MAATLKFGDILQILSRNGVDFILVGGRPGLGNLRPVQGLCDAISSTGVHGLPCYHLSP